MIPLPARMGAGVRPLPNRIHKTLERRTLARTKVTRQVRGARLVCLDVSLRRKPPTSNSGLYHFSHNIRVTNKGILVYADRKQNGVWGEVEATRSNANEYASFSFTRLLM